MKKIDNSVVAAVNEVTTDEEDKGVRVLVACVDACASLVEQLEKTGANIAQEIPELNMLVVEIKKPHLQILEDSENVDSVELDEDVSINDE